MGGQTIDNAASGRRVVGVKKKDKARRVAVPLGGSGRIGVIKTEKKEIVLSAKNEGHL